MLAVYVLLGAGAVFFGTALIIGLAAIMIAGECSDDERERGGA